MGSEGHTLHILFFPLMAQGHMLPMIDMAKLFAACGVKATILTTPANASIIQPSVDRAKDSGSHHRLQLHLIPFPSGTGLPEGCENLSSVSSEDMHFKFFSGVGMLRQPFDRVLRELLPDCVVTDMFFPWTYDAAAELGIPRLVFHGTSFFSQCAFDSLDRHKPLDNLPAEAEAKAVAIPGLPHQIKMFKTQIPDLKKAPPFWIELFSQMKESEPKSYGVVVNSFYELEPDYARHYRKVVGRKAWHVGPLSLCNKDIVDKFGRGNKASIDHDTCLKWLDGMRPGSVVYVCFGTMTDFTTAQLREIALGLEASNHPFIWVVRKSSEEWMPEGLEERVEGRGLIIRGWAPQILILNHRAVGGFVTHCGWNSSLEGVSAGLPLVTWPLFAEQFYNEKLIVDVLKIGVEVGTKKYSIRPEEREVVEAAKIEEAVDLLMGGGEEAEERRRRARQLEEMARRAVEKGGSSYNDMGNLIQELMEWRITTYV